jgi:drug/metabolite transporter (DMT)-like permease
MRDRSLLVSALSCAAGALLLVLLLDESTQVWVGAGVLLVAAAALLVVHLRRGTGRGR